MHPLFIICISYIIGILFAPHIFNLTKNNLFILGVAILLGNIFLFYLRKGNFLIISILCIISCFSASYWYNYSLPKPQSNDLSYYSPEKNIVAEGFIINEPKIKTDKISFKFVPEIILEPKIMLSSGISLVTVYSDRLKPKYGDKIRIKGNLSLPPGSPNPGGFSYAEFLKRDSIFSLINIYSENNIQILESETKNDFQSFILKTKETLLNTFYKNMPEDSANLVSSLIFGAKAAPIAKDIQNEFINLGLAHVLAASGMQISLIIFLGVIFTKRLSKFISIMITSFTVIFYMLLTGLPPSILRAGLAGLIVLFVSTKRNPVDSFKVLMIVSTTLAIYEPLILFDIGFQFSILATFALLYASPAISKKLEFLPPFIAETISLILSAQLFVLPLQLFYFGQFSWLFLPANILAAVFVDLLTYMAILTLTFGLIIPISGYIFGNILFFILSIFLFFIHLLAKLPFSVSYIARPEILTVILLYLLFFLIIELIKITSKSRLKFNFKFISLMIIFVFCTAGFTYNKIENQQKLEVDFINVGQGDSSMIKTPEGKIILIDCGQAYQTNRGNKIINYDAAKKYIVPYLKQKGIKTIDLLILTHPDSDHIGGFNSIAENFEIKSVLDSGQTDDSNIYNEALGTILKQNIELKTASKGIILKENDFSLNIINEIHPESIAQHSYNNNNAIAIKLVYKKVSMLFMADLEKEAEFRLSDAPIDLKADVLKVGHHGSKTSTSDQFLLKVMPKISVISVGKYNHYGHPAKSVIERLESSGSKIYRTDNDGGVEITSDGEKLKTITTKNY